MNRFPDVQAAGGLVHSSLSADEYRLLADLLLEQIEIDPLREDQFTPLAQRLFVLAVQADSRTSKAI